jgi:hypothetical protein
MSPEFRVSSLAVILAWAAGCGGGSDGSWAPVIGGNELPVIDHFRLEHDDPEAPGHVIAVVEAHDPDGDAIEIDYVWTVAGVVRPETGPEMELPRARKGTRVEVVATASDGRAASLPARRVVHLRNPLPEPSREAWQSVRQGEGREGATSGEEPELSRAEGPRDVARPGERVEREPGADSGRAAVRYAVQVPFTDGESRTRFRLLQGPEGMWVHPASGEVTWVPESWQTGSHPVEVEVTDADGVVAVEAFTVDSGLEPSAVIDSAVPDPVGAPRPEVGSGPTLPAKAATP